MSCQNESRVVNSISIKNESSILIDSIYIGTEGVDIKLYFLEPDSDIKKSYKVTEETTWESVFFGRFYTRDSVYIAYFGYHSNSRAIKKHLKLRFDKDQHISEIE